MFTRIGRSVNTAWDQIANLRSDAGWVNRGIVGVVVTALGLMADFLTPWFNLLSWLLPIAVVISIVGIGLWCRVQRPPGEPLPRMRRLAASTAMYGLVSTLILAPIFMLNLAMGNSSGAVASMLPAAEDLQAYIAQRFDHLDKALSSLTDSVGKQTDVVEKVQETMEFSVALALVDRARAARDGANQGQAQAMESLLARGHDFVDSDFSGVSLARARLDRANFFGGPKHFLNLDGASLRGANFSRADLRFATAREVDFTKADLSTSYAPFFNGKGAKFIGAVLRGANFFAADLSSTDFTGADLTGAVLAFANLREANFTGANLDGAYLTGALLDTAILTDTRLNGTNMLGVVRDPASLSPVQSAGICRHSMSDPRFRIELIERWEGAQFSSGYEFKNLSQWVDDLNAPSLNDQTLPLCAGPAKAAVSFDAQHPANAFLHLNRTYLDKAGRRVDALNRLKNFYALLREAYATGPFLAGSGDYRRVWLQQMRQRAAVTTPVGAAYIDSDLMLVWLLSKSIFAAEHVDWEKMVKVRLGLEKLDAANPRALSRWDALFPAEAQFADLSPEAIDLFRDWTLRRHTALDEVLVFQPASFVGASDGSGSRKLSLDTGFIRYNIEKLSTSNSWPNQSVRHVTKAVGDLRRTQFAPIHIPLREAGIDRVILVFPENYKRYALIFPDSLRVTETNPDLEIDLKPIEVRRLEVVKGIVLVFVALGEARIRDDKGEVIFTGQLQVMPE